MAIKTEDLSNTFHGYSELVGADKLLQAIVDLGADVNPGSLEAILCRFCKFKFSEIHGTSQASEYSTAFQQMREKRKHGECGSGGRACDYSKEQYPFEETTAGLHTAIKKIEITLNKNLNDLLEAYPQITDIRIDDETIATKNCGTSFVTPPPPVQAHVSET